MSLRGLSLRFLGSAVLKLYGLRGLKGLATHTKAGRGGMSLRVLSLRFLGSAVFLKLYGLRGLKGLATHTKAGRVLFLYGFLGLNGLSLPRRTNNLVQSGQSVESYKRS